MSDKDTVFTPEANSETPKEVLTELVGDGKKYKTVEDLARSYLHADIHIAQLQEENKQFREKLAGAKTVEDVLEAVKAGAVSGRDSPDVVIPNNAQPGLTAAEINALVQEQMTGFETQKQRTANRNKADAKMRELFGDKAQEVFNRTAATPELRKIYTELAEVDADKFISLFQREPERAPTDGGSNRRVDVINTPAGGLAEAGTQAFYSKMRKENPSLYYSAATQLQMHKAALSNPDKYFGRKIA